MEGGKEASTNIVRFLKTDPRARYQGYKFYFREGFCWIDVNSTYLKARLKAVGVFDVLSMSLFTQTQLPDSYFVGLINSEFVSLYVDNFINNTSHFQINDARQLPIVVPSYDMLKELIELVANACSVKKGKTVDCQQPILEDIQSRLDNLVLRLYQID